MAITLGKDCTVSVGGNVASARNVTFSSSARTIEVEEFGSRYSTVYTTGHEQSVSIEFNDSDDVASLMTALETGEQITVSGGAAGWSFPAVVTGVSENDSIDGVATFTVEARRTRDELR